MRRLLLCLVFFCSCVAFVPAFDRPAPVPAATPTPTPMPTPTATPEISLPSYGVRVPIHIVNMPAGAGTTTIISCQLAEYPQGGGHAPFYGETNRTLFATPQPNNVFTRTGSVIMTITRAQIPYNAITKMGYSCALLTNGAFVKPATGGNGTVTQVTGYFDPATRIVKTSELLYYGIPTPSPTATPTPGPAPVAVPSPIPAYSFTVPVRITNLSASKYTPPYSVQCNVSGASAAFYGDASASVPGAPPPDPTTRSSAVNLNANVTVQVSETHFTSQTPAMSYTCSLMQGANLHFVPASTFGSGSVTEITGTFPTVTYNAIATSPIVVNGP